MTKSTPVFLALAAVSMTVAAPAVACDLHGPGQFGAFHRYNPFASVIQNLPDLPKTSPTETRAQTAKAMTEKGEKAAQERKRRERALDQSTERRQETVKAADLTTKADKTKIR